MKHLFPLSTIIAFSFLVITGCQNDTDELPAPKTKTELITASSWKFDKAMTGSFDISGNINACYKDNVVAFISATNGTVSEGAVVCASPAPATFTWSFQSSETVLNLSAALFTGSTGLFNIISLTDASLVISQDVIVPPSSTATNVVFYYKH